MDNTSSVFNEKEFIEEEEKKCKNMVESIDAICTQWQVVIDNPASAPKVNENEQQEGQFMSYEDLYRNLIHSLCILKNEFQDGITKIQDNSIIERTEKCKESIDESIRKVNRCYSLYANK
jgi:hypothetical protein